MTTMKDKIKDLQHIMDIIAVNIDSIIYVPFEKDIELTEYTDYSSKGQLKEIALDILKGEKDKIISGDYGNIKLYEEDVERLWADTRKHVVLKKLDQDKLYYVFFRAFIGGNLHHFKVKFVGEWDDNRLIGIVIAIVDDGIRNKVQRENEEKMNETIEEVNRNLMEKTAELRDKTLALSMANAETIELLGNIIEFRNKESGLHIRRVKTFTRALAEQVQKDCPEYMLTDETVDYIVSASSLHDVGKIMVPDAILMKPGKLTDEERLEMQRHCEYGIEVLAQAPQSWTAQYTKIAKDICSCHHEKWDGNGYPYGLKGDDIPIAAQIVSVADCYDALTTERVYKPAFSNEKAYEMIVGGECGVFSDKLLACLEKSKEKFAQIASDPTKYYDKMPVQLSGEHKLNDLNILLVDDNAMNLEITADTLEEEGAIITTAENGRVAINMFVNCGPFDAVIMDLVMPGMSGIEATKRIREIESVAGTHVPVIALSADAPSDEEMQEAGIDACMAKPLVVGEFARILISCMQNNSMKMQRKLTETLKTANTDTLTKVKSIAAYTDMISSVNSEINSNSETEFAIAMCDINDLKQANDTCGHEVGNIYIKNCCKLLREYFAVSPIYRIGGDEFVVLLQGNEYKQRKVLIETLKDRVYDLSQIRDYRDGRVSFAIGISDFDPETDTDVRDVQLRADHEMYQHKKRIKMGGR